MARRKVRVRKGKRSALVRLGGVLYRVELVKRPKVSEAAAGRRKRRRKSR